MLRKLVVAVMTIVPLSLAVHPLSTSAALPIFENANESVHCDDFVGQVVFKTPLKRGGVTPGQAVWTATSNDCHDQNAGEYDRFGNPAGVALKRAVVKGMFNYDSNDCNLLEAGGDGTFLGGQLTVTWTTTPGTPALAQKTSTISYFKLGWNWDYFGFGQFLHLTLGDGLEPTPAVTGAFTGGDGGALSQINATISQSHGSLLSSAACSTTGISRINFGIGYFRLG